MTDDPGPGAAGEAVAASAVASARARAAAFAAREPLPQAGPARSPRRWPWLVGAGVAGVLTAGVIVVVTGWPVEGRPSLARLRDVQRQLDADIEQSQAPATTGLDVLRGVVVLHRHEDGVCERPLGLRSGEDWDLVVTERDHRTGSCGPI